MKKKIFSLAVIAIVAVAAAVGVSKNANKVELSEITLANVEALAMDELPGTFSYFVHKDFGSDQFGEPHIVTKCVHGGTRPCA